MTSLSQSAPQSRCADLGNAIWEEAQHKCPFGTNGHKLLCDGQVIYRADGHSAGSGGQWPTIDLERAKAECAARTAHIIGEL